MSTIRFNSYLHKEISYAAGITKEMVVYKFEEKIFSDLINFWIQLKDLFKNIKNSKNHSLSETEKFTYRQMNRIDAALVTVGNTLMQEQVLEAFARLNVHLNEYQLLAS